MANIGHERFEVPDTPLHRSAGAADVRRSFADAEPEIWSRVRFKQGKSSIVPPKSRSKSAHVGVIRDGKFVWLS